MCLSSRVCRVRRCGCSAQQVPVSGRYLFVKHCSIHHPCDEGKRHRLRQTGHGASRMRLRRTNQALRCDKRPLLGTSSSQVELDVKSSPLVVVVPSHVDKSRRNHWSLPRSLGALFPVRPPPFPQPQGCMMTDPDEEALPCGRSDT